MPRYDENSRIIYRYSLTQLLNKRDKRDKLASGRALTK